MTSTEPPISNDTDEAEPIADGEPAAAAVEALSLIKRATRYWQSSDQLVRERPAVAIGIAAGLGALAGASLMLMLLKARD